jgi:hypothetical protein
VELTYFFNDNKEKKNVSVSYKASFCGSSPSPPNKTAKQAAKKQRLLSTIFPVLHMMSNRIF